MESANNARVNLGQLLCLVLLLSSLAQAVTLWTGTPRAIPFNERVCATNEIACGSWGSAVGGVGNIYCCTLAPGISLGSSRTNVLYTTYGCEPNEVVTGWQFGNTMTCTTLIPAMTLTSTNGGPFNQIYQNNKRVGATCNTDAGYNFALGWSGFCAYAQFAPCAGTTSSCGNPGSCQACAAPPTTYSANYCSGTNLIRTVTTYAPICGSSTCAYTSTPQVQTVQTCTAPAPVLGGNYCSGNSVYQARTVYAPLCNSNTCSSSESRSDVFVQACANGCLNGACVAATPTPTPGSACTPSEITETFETFTAGQTSLSGWTIFNDVATSVTVRDNTGIPGKAVELSDANAQTGSASGRFTGAAYLIKSIQPSPSGSASFDVFAKQTTGQLGFEVFGEKGDFIYLYMDDNGEFRYWNQTAGAYVGLGKTYVANQWYHIEVRWFGTTFDVLIDGQKINSAPLPYSYPANAGSAYYVYFFTGGQSVQGTGYTGTFLIDNVRYPGCSGSPSPSPTPSPLCRTAPRLSRFPGTGTTNINNLLSNPLAELKSVNGFALDAPGSVKITYLSGVNVCNQDFDSNVAFGPGWFSFNDAALDSTLVRPSRIGSAVATVILSFPPTITRPQVRYASGFHNDPVQILQNAQPCPPTQCQNIAFLNGKAIFDAASFSDYIVTNEETPTPSINPLTSPTPNPSGSPSPTPPLTPPATTNELKIRCPVGIVVEENTTVSVFFTPQGLPSCVNQGMQIQAIGNNTSQNTKFISCNSKNGQHVFSVNTTASGKYKITAQYAGILDSCNFDVVGRAPTPTPEISPILILAAALIGFGVTLQRKNATKLRP